MKAVAPLLKAFESTVWKGIEDIFNAVKKVLDPLKEVFKPFEPLQELLHREVEIPWFQLPYLQKNHG